MSKFRMTNKNDGTVTYAIEGGDELVLNVIKLLTNKQSTPATKPVTKKVEKQEPKIEIPRKIEQTEVKERSRTLPLKSHNENYAHKEQEGFSIGDVLNKEMSSEKSHFYTGIKVDDDGQKRYQCRYICPNCKTKSKHYVYTDEKEIDCHECGEHMEVKSIEDYAGVEKDNFNNFYYAGLYIPRESSFQ